jgi:dTDP-glucose 4,6-dehydratase
MEKLMNYKVAIVTGCFGFIGNHLTVKLLRDGWYVFGIDKHNYVSDTSQLEFISENFPNKYKFINGDISKIKRLPQCDVLFNLAAESYVENSFHNSNKFIKSNIDGVRNLLEIIQDTLSSYDKPLFVQMSTDEVYGDIEKGSFDEESPLNPSNPYSATKASADLFIKSWAKTYGQEYLILRPSNNYGTLQYHEKLIPLAVKRLKENKLIKLHNHGRSVRTWTHVKDTIEAITLLAEKADRNRIYNISSEFEQNNFETAQKIINCFFMGRATVNVPDFNKYIDFSYNRPGQDVRYAISCNHLKQYGWSAKHPFNTEIVNIVNYYRERFVW